MIIIFAIISIQMNAQVGGRMKERKNQKRIIVHSKKSGWNYRATKTGKPYNWRREGRWLFRRNLTKGKISRERQQVKINNSRSKKRIRGNVVFSKRKY